MIKRNVVSADELKLEIDGDLTGANAQELSQELESVLSESYKTLTLEMTETTAINSASIGRILLARKKYKDANIGIRIVGCSDVIYEALTSLNLDRLISVRK
jgi:anti-anti-sigma factor